MSFIPFTEKIQKKKIEICSILGRIRIGPGSIRIPGGGSLDPDPHQNYADPKHCMRDYKLYGTLCI